MKKLILLLLVLVALLQWRLWFGDGGIYELHEMQAHIEELKEKGEKLHERNAALEADVMDLKEGTDAIEERARQELGMVKDGETFVQVFEKPRTVSESSRSEAEAKSPRKDKYPKKP